MHEQFWSRRALASTLLLFTTSALGCDPEEDALPLDTEGSLELGDAPSDSPQTHALELDYDDHVDEDPAAYAESFSAEALEQRAMLGTRPLLVIVVQGTGTVAPARTLDDYDELIFGPAFPNLVDYYSEVSKNRFTFTRADVIQVNDRRDSAFLTRAGAIGDASTNDMRLRARMLADDAGFPFDDYDADGDGSVTTDELSILVIDTYSSGSGQNGSPGCIAHPDGTNVCSQVALTGHRSEFANFAHELSHQLSPGSADLYGTNCHSNRMTLASCTALGATSPALETNRLYHIDPWHRLAYGWTGGSRITSDASTSGSVTLAPLSSITGPFGTGTELLVLNRGSNDESLMFEYRVRAGYDRDVEVEGVLAWYTESNGAGIQPGNLTTLVGLSGSGSDPAHFVLAPDQCVGWAQSVDSRGRAAAMRPGSSYRMRWRNGQDSGYLFTVGLPDANGNVTLSWLRTNVNPRCDQPQPDLHVSALSGVPSSVYLGGSFSLSETTTNRGNGPARLDTMNSYVLSTDTRYSPGDIALGWREVPALDPGRSSSNTARVTIPTSTPYGTYRVLVCTDLYSSVLESNESNNCRTSGTLEVRRLIFDPPPFWPRWPLPSFP